MYGSLQRRKEGNEQFRRKINQDVYGNRKLFWKEVSKERWRVAAK